MNPRPYAPFALPAFRLFMSYRALSVIAGEIVLTAIGWQIYVLSHSAVALGGIGLSQVLPVVTLALWAGHLADRMDRRTILFRAQLTHALGCAGLAAWTWLGAAGLWPAYAILTLFGVARAFQGPSNASYLLTLLPPRDAPTAITWSTTLFHGFIIIGPLLGGLIIAQWGIGGAYAVGALLGGAGALLLRGCPARPPARTPEHAEDGGWKGGIRYVRTHPILLGAMTLDLLAVLFGGATALLPIFAKDILGVGPEGLGALRAAPAVGSILLSFSLLHAPPFQRAGRAFLACVALYGVSMIGFGWSTSFLLSLACLTAGGMADAVSVVIRHVLILTSTPDHLRGRVSAVAGIFIQSSNKLGEFESGVVAALIGVAPSVVVGGALTLASVALIGWAFPALRRLGALTLDPH